MPAARFFLGLTRIMTAQHPLYSQAQDDLHELQERLAERRREYFKLVGAPSQARVSAGSPWRDQASASWRDLFAVRTDIVDFSSARTPKPIVDRYIAWQRDARSPAALIQAYRQFRSNWANALKVHPDELVLTRSTTDAMMYGFRGMNWQKHDLCVTTNMEHSGGLGALYAMVNRFGMQTPQWGTPVEVDPATGAEISGGVFALRRDGNVLSLPTGVALHEQDPCGYPILANASSYDEAFFALRLQPVLDRIVDQAAGSCKALFFSSPSFITGVRLPEAQLAQWAWRRNIRTILDGAHLAGMVDVDLHAMGVDFCAVSGHKWQCGSPQTGVAYLRRGRRRVNETVAPGSSGRSEAVMPPYANPTPVPEFWTDMNGQVGELLPGNAAALTPVTHQDPAYSCIRGVDECCQLWDALGRPLIDTYVVLLSQYLRWRLSEICPVTALISEFRQQDGQSWADVWHPVRHAGRFPVHCRTGLTAWTPFSCAQSTTDYPRTDACAALTVEQSQMQEYRAKHLLSRLSAQFGICARSTRCPHQLRAGGGRYVANAMPDVGPVTASSPLRFSTYLYHRVEDIDRLAGALTHPDITALYDMTA